MTATEGAGLVDTNLVVAFARVAPEDLPEMPLISTITLAEFSVGPLVATDPPEQARRQQWLHVVEASFDPLPFDDAAAPSSGSVTASLRAFSRKPSAPGDVALIAAVAIPQGIPLHTAKPDNLAHIEGLDRRCVWRVDLLTPKEQD